MKNLRLLLMLAGLTGLMSCDRDTDTDTKEYLVAHPLTLAVADFEASVGIVAPKPLEQSGKIYAYGDYIFVNEPYKGVHLIDNRNPSSPVKSGFITIPGNIDISVKDDYLFADSLSDLVVLDISGLDNIRPVARLRDVLQSNIPWPFEADFVDYDGWDSQDEILVGWELRTERMTEAEAGQRGMGPDILMAEMANADAGTGQGGSLARFKIAGEYLYAVDSHTLNVFDISDLETPVALEDVFAGFDIETIFNRGDYLFLGSMRGMYIYDISSPATPAFVSEFEHGTACDPVVVDGDYAFVTLRGGNGCGATESGLFVVDISTIQSPELVASYGLDGPYGLGVQGNQLFVCDGPSGLRVFDKTDVANLTEIAVFQDVTPYDVIPLQEHLLLIGDGQLSQYRYSATGLEWISSLVMAE